MCGRYLVITEDEIIEMRAILQEINSRYETDYYIPFYQTGEIFPTNFAPVITNDNLLNKSENSNIITPLVMKWGFDKWDNTGVIINARSETINQKPFFKNSFETMRCIIPANGFFEWKRDINNKAKEKYLFTMPNDKMIYMAGIFKPFNNSEQPQVNYQFTILTKDANESVSDIHNRMPVLLKKDQINGYLHDDQTALQLIRENNVYLEKARA